MLETTVGVDVPELTVSIDGGGQLGALTGKPYSVVELERSVMDVVAPEDTATCNSVCAAVVGTCTVRGDGNVSSSAVP